MSKPADTNGVPDLAAECAAWKTRYAEASEERDRLRAENAQVKSERDAYRKSLGCLMSKEAPPPNFTKEELLACVGQEPPLEEFIAELEREMRSGA